MIRKKDKLTLTERSLDKFIYMGHYPGDEIIITEVSDGVIQYLFKNKKYYVSSVTLRDNQKYIAG